MTSRGAYQFSLRAISSYLPALPHAVLVTLELSVVAILLSTVVGLLGALARTNARSRTLRIVGTAYVELLRNVPLLVVLYLIYFGLPELGWQISGFAAAILGLTLNSGAYMTEIFRGGLLAIPKTQYESATSLGMTVGQTLRYVILPQLFRAIYAPFGNQCIGVILGSSLAFIVTVPELNDWMQTTGSNSFRFFEAFAVAGLIYVALCQLVNGARLLIGRALFRADRDRVYTH